MTIRDHLNRKKRILVKVWLYSLPASLVLQLILILLADRLGLTHALPGFVYFAPLIIGAAVFMAMSLRIKVSVGMKCPRCTRRTVTLKTRLTGDLFSIPDDLEACPSCGVDFDQEYGEPESTLQRERSTDAAGKGEGRDDG